MALRDLTTTELTTVEAAWNAYLEVADRAETVEEVGQAWDDYRATLDSLNVSETLMGPKVRIDDLVWRKGA